MFKVGDKVFHILHGWGIINEITCYTMEVHFMEVHFENNEVHGFSNSNLFSFTEYTLQGFTQERPIILPEVGELCLVKDADNEDWYVVKFKERDKNRMPHQFISLDDTGWQQMKRIKILD